jgi:heme/copper-type cytochrome/quinol oxidase subunit 4
MLLFVLLHSVLQPLTHVGVHCVIWRFPIRDGSGCVSVTSLHRYLRILSFKRPYEFATLSAWCDCFGSLNFVVRNHCEILSFAWTDLAPRIFWIQNWDFCLIYEVLKSSSRRPAISLIPTGSLWNSCWSMPTLHCAVFIFALSSALANVLTRNHLLSCLLKMASVQVGVHIHYLLVISKSRDWKVFLVRSNFLLVKIPLVLLGYFVKVFKQVALLQCQNSRVVFLSSLFK